jgi:hypothetical protein
MGGTVDALSKYADLALTGLLGILWYDIRNLRKTYMTKANHDEVCDLKLNPIHDDVTEIKADIKELLKRNGGPRS